MTAIRVLIALLAVAWGPYEALAEKDSTGADGTAPAPLSIRDYQGRLVAMPEPNPVRPVNYIKWLIETLGSGIADNAASLYEEAYRLEKPVQVKDDEFEKARKGPWEGLESVSAWLTANRVCLKKFRQATSQRQCYFQLRFESSSEEKTATTKPAIGPRTAEFYIAAWLPETSTHRRIQRMLIADGWQAWKQGDEDRIVENAFVLLQDAQHFEEQPTTILHLVGSAAAVLAYDNLIEAMWLSRESGALAGRLAGRLSATVDPPLELSEVRSLVLDYALFRDFGQRVFMPGRKSGQWQVRPGMQWGGFAAHPELAGKLKDLDDPNKRLAEIGYEATLREGDELTRRFQAWLRKPYHASAKEGENIKAAIETSRNPLIRVLMPDLTRARVLDERRIAHRRATHLIVQLLLFHAKNRAYPERLNKLKAADLREIRIDPFSGNDFGYRRQGDGFLLYSVAEDLRDDDGQHDKSWKKGDYVFWPVQGDRHSGPDTTKGKGGGEKGLSSK